MGKEYALYLESLAQKIMDNMSSRNNNVFVIKHYNTFEILNSSVQELENKYSDCNVFFKSFKGSGMVDAYDPFLYVIRKMYWRYYKYLGIREFVAGFPVYSLHRSIFESYIADGNCNREEDLILSEVEYEKEQLDNSIIAMLTALSKEHPMLLLIDNLTCAGQSTFHILDKLFDAPDNGCVGIIAAYNDLKPVLPHSAKVWERYVEKLETANCLMDGMAFSGSISKDSDGSFRFHSSDIEEYLCKLNNMLYTLDFEQAHYYLGILYKKLEMEKMLIQDYVCFEIYKIYARISIYSDDIANALLLCNSMNAIRKKRDSKDMNYEYWYLFGLTQVYNTKLQEAKDCADICYGIACEQRNEFYKFKAKLLKVMASMSGWHNILFCANDIVVEDDLIKAAEYFHYRNHLAHIYVYAYDNTIDWHRDIEDIDKSLSHFRVGIAIAEQLGNKYLISVGYRKVIMLSSLNGAFEHTTYYYHQLHDVVGDSDPVQEADIYKGLGYNNCAIEKYEEANDCYNKAIAIYYRLNMIDYIGETLYNMSLTCILAENYEQAYDYLQMCIRIVNALHLNNLRVCNISKVFGLLALCSYRLHYYYNCQMYVDNTMQFLSNRLNDQEEGDTIDPSYTACDDDMFLLYYAKALLAAYQENYEEASQLLDYTEIYMERSVGNQFFTYVQYKLSRSEVYRHLGNEEAAMRELDDAERYAEANNAEEKLRKIRAIKEGKEWKPLSYNLALEGVALEDINVVTKQASINKKYDELTRQMEFISIWQKIIDINGKEKEELITNALNSFIVNFSMDVVIYVRYEDGQPKVHFSNTQVPVSEERLSYLTEHFERHRTGFVVSKMKKNYREYSNVVSLFGANDVCSMIGIPFFTNEKLEHLFICYVRMKDNWNAPANKYMLDENDFNIYSLLFRQLADSVHMLEKQSEINLINTQLENAAVTDYLTLLFNREGLFSNLRKMIDNSKKTKRRLELSVLYIDLDNFKYYNDNFGHDVGDFVLKKIAKILKDKSRGYGFAARFGGDEFLVVLEGSDADAAMKKAREILNTILANEAFREDIKEFLGTDDVVIPEEKKVSCSIGVALLPDVKEVEDVNAALRCADEALYAIKHTTKCDCKLANS